MFDCRICTEKDKRINDLQVQLATLQRLVFPVYPAKRTLPIIDTETGQEMQVEILEAEPHNELAAEADALLSGTY